MKIDKYVSGTRSATADLKAGIMAALRTLESHLINQAAIYQINNTVDWIRAQAAQLSA